MQIYRSCLQTCGMINEVSALIILDLCAYIFPLQQVESSCKF